MKEILVLDDEEMIRHVFQYTVDRLNKLYGKEELSLSLHPLGSQAIKEIQLRDKPFDAYFVDMRIPKELNSSEELFYEVQKKFSIDSFFFMTGHVSEHDITVFDRTTPKHFNKPFGVCDTLRALIENKSLDQYISDD